MSTVVTSSGFSLFLREMDLKQFHATVSGYANSESKGSLTNRQRIDFLLQFHDLFKTADFPPTRHLGEWFIQSIMDTTHPLTDTKFAIIEDTVNYINTGYRRLPLAVYADLLRQETSDRQNHVSHVVSVDVNHRLNANEVKKRLIQVIRDMGEDVLYRWTKTNEGFIDFIYFLKYISAER